MLIMHSVYNLSKYKMFVCQRVKGLEPEGHVPILYWLLHCCCNDLIGSCNRHNDDKKIRVVVQAARVVPGRGA